MAEQAPMLGQVCVYRRPPRLVRHPAQRVHPPVGAVVVVYGFVPWFQDRHTSTLAVGARMIAHRFGWCCLSNQRAASADQPRHGSGDSTRCRYSVRASVSTQSPDRPSVAL